MKQFLLILALCASLATQALTIDDFCGQFEWSYLSNLSWETSTKTAAIEITKHNTPGKVLIKGLYLNYTLVADVNVNDGTLAIRNQNIDVDMSMGTLAVFKTVVENDEYVDKQEPIVGRYVNGSIMFDPDEMFSVGYPSYPGYYFVMTYNNEFNPYEDRSFVFDPAEWEMLPNAKFTDGWLTYHYFGGGTLAPTYEVKMARNIANPNLFCIVNPYDNVAWLPYNKDLQAQGHIVFDIENPDFVKLQTHVYSGFTDKDEGKLYMYSTDSHYHFVEGWDYDQLYNAIPDHIATLRNKKVLEIPDPCFGNEARPVGLYSWSTNESVGARLEFDFTMGVDLNPADVESADATPEYFDLQGRRIAEPATGIYLKKTGKKVEKVVK